MTSFCTNLQGTFIHHELKDAFAPQVAEFLLAQFERLEAGVEDPFTDNYRFCDVCDEEQHTEYLYRESNGGGRAVDEAVVLEGVTYLIGFNYEA